MLKIWKHIKATWVLYAGILLAALIMTTPAWAAEQFVGVGGGVDLNAPGDSTFDFTWGYELADGQYLATTLRSNPRASDVTEDFIQRIVVIEPLKLELVGIGSVGATSGQGVTKLDFGGGVGGIYDMSRFSDKLKGLGLFVGAKFMRNNFAEPDKAGGLSRIVLEVIYRWGE